MDSLSESYRAEGCTDVVRVLDEADLEPLQTLIFGLTAHLLPAAACEQPLGERLRLPLVRNPAADDLARLMNTVNASTELRQVAELPAVTHAFRVALGCDAIEPFPVWRFRAQIPGVPRSSFSWHQDEATWYAVKVKHLAHRLPATLWLSLNGASASNSIEVIPGSHDRVLVRHRHRVGQGYFQAVVPSAVGRLGCRRIEARAGEGMFLHPLAFHRSVPSPGGAPRYSVDLRYCARSRPRAAYPVDWRFRLKRWLTR